MKIIFPIGSFYPAQSGGPNNTIFWLSKSLKKNNFKTTVVTTDKDITNKEIIFDQFINNDVGKIIYCKEYYYRFPIKLIKNSIKVMDKSDIIHLTSLFYVPSLILAYFAKKKNKKIVWSVRGELEESALNFNILLKKIYLKIIKNILNKNFIFHSTSYNETKNINKYFKNSKVIQIPNYIEMPKKQNKNIKKQFLFLGRIHPIKNIELLIKSISELKNFKEKRFKLIIAGTGKNNYIKKLKKLITKLNLDKEIKFIGFIDGKEKNILLSESYFLVLPSLSENFGNVIIESMAQSTPVITSKGTPWEIINKYNAGYYIDNSIDQWIKTIKKTILLNKDEYIKMRRNSYRLIDKKFNIQYNIKNWVSAYGKILNEK